ncbi:MAG: DUF429 domain-containing protein [Bdellovibrio sp.]|jgi:hypothetical protein
MRKSRVSSPSRKNRSSSQVTESKFVRYLGLSLSGGKSDKSCLAVIDHYFDPKRLFLSRLHEKIRTEEFVSADHKILEMIGQLKDNAVSIMIDAPLTLPKCVACPHTCHGYETCTEPEIKWMRQMHQKLPKKRPRKMFTPYTQRPVDLYLSELEEENLDVQHALGANLAPITARAMYLKRRMPLDCFEVFPKLSVWRLGNDLRVNKSHLRSYRNSVGGEDARRIFLNALVEKTGLFLYQQDFKLVCENPHAFDSLITAFTGYLKAQKKTQERPEDFPKNEAWVEFPKSKIF